jgi:hypothetical protein
MGGCRSVLGASVNRNTPRAQQGLSSGRPDCETDAYYNYYVPNKGFFEERVKK